MYIHLSVWCIAKAARPAIPSSEPAATTRRGDTLSSKAVLKPGTFARVHIASGKIDTVVTLPYATMQYRYGVNRVFVVDGDKLVARELRVGDRLGDRIEILGGVKAGDRVAASDIDKLIDGQKVSVK